MERDRRITETTVAKALRSLERNRALRQVADRRIENAESQIRGYLMTEGKTNGKIAGYQVELQDEEVHITRLPFSENGSRQLALRMQRGNSIAQGLTIFEPGSSSEDDQQETNRQIAWIKENSSVFWEAAQSGYAASGHGAIAVGVEVVELDGMRGHPYIYLGTEELEMYQWQEAARNASVYEPAREFVAVLVKPEGESVYRMGMPSHTQSHL